MDISMIKLQVANIILLFFISVLQIGAKNEKKKTNFWFLLINIISIVQVVFDALRVCAANDMIQTSDFMNRYLYKTAVIWLLVLCWLVYRYMITIMTEETHKKTPINWFLVVCYVITFLAILIGKVRVVETNQGNYFISSTVYIFYGMVVLFVAFWFGALQRYRKMLPQKKRVVMWVTILSELVVLIYQACVPVAFVSSIAIVVINFGIYLMLENPDAILAKKLREETARADAANNAKSTFLANMSHEVRTPITAVLGMNELILRETKEPAIRRYANDIEASARSLLSIINDVLDIVKIESGKLTITKVEYQFSNLLYDISNMVSIKAKAKGLSMVYEVGETIPNLLRGDDIRVRQILLNLLNNAVKYTNEGTICLKIKELEKTEEKVTLEFCVQDTGIGIKEEEISKLFQPFERLDQVKNYNVEGTGLGLSITQELLKKMNSELNVSSEYGKGSAFSFVLTQDIVDITPIGKIENILFGTQEVVEVRKTFVAPEAKILIVDDNEMNRKVFVGLLKHLKVQIDEAGDGEKCLELAVKNHYDIIFMDHMMPGMDGIETKKKLDEMKDSPNIDTPIVMLTANAVLGAKAQYFAEGFDAFLAKPIMPDKLEKVIYSFLNKELLGEEVHKQEEQDEDSWEQNDKLVDGLDWSYAKLHFSDTKELQEMIVRFSAVIKSDAKELASYYESIHEELSRKQFQTKVHSMKNSAATVGIIPLAGMAKVLEDAAREKEYQVLEAVLPVFLEKWCGYEACLREAFQDKNRELKSANENMEKIRDILKQIKDAAEEMDIDELDRLLECLEGYEYKGDMEKDMNEIRIAIQNFDLDYLMCYNIP